MSGTVAVHDEVTEAHEPPAGRALTPRAAQVALACLLLLAGLVITAASLRNSTTFDEIVMVAGGARGYETGNWKLVPEHPPLVQYLYGIIPHAAGINYPDESSVSDELMNHMGYRYRYAQFMYWRVGNDPERLALLGRIPAILCTLLLALLVFAWTRRNAGDAAALLAAFLTLTLPDILTHGGIAYNDVPLALLFFAAVWAVDAAVRTPSLARAALAGLLIALSLGVKNSAVALGPIAVLLLLWEGMLRRRDRTWLRAIVPAVLATIAASYLTLVVVYRGDFMLEEYRYALGFMFRHTTELRVPAYLFGEVTREGFWYYFPVVFFLKTSAGLHLLMLIAAGFFVRALTQRPRAVAHTRLRAPLVAALVFMPLLVTSDLNIGFRHALPLLPLICVITAIGVARAAATGPRIVRMVAGIALVFTALSPATAYPHFVSYVSEYSPGGDELHHVLADSSVDWGQGLLALRDFMRDAGISSVYLSYFGSAIPEGYGISYIPLESFFPLEPPPPVDSPPQWVAISATNLTAAYLTRDPFAQFRDREPAAVIGGSIYLFPLSD